MKDKDNDFKFLLWFKFTYPTSFEKYKKEFGKAENFDIKLKWNRG